MLWEGTGSNLNCWRRFNCHRRCIPENPIKEQLKCFWLHLIWASLHNPIYFNYFLLRRNQIKVFHIASEELDTRNPSTRGKERNSLVKGRIELSCKHFGKLQLVGWVEPLRNPSFLRSEVIDIASRPTGFNPRAPSNILRVEGHRDLS